MRNILLSGPDGRMFYGYIIVIASSLVMAVSSGAIYSFSVFFEPLQSQFGWSRAVTSGAFSAFVVLNGAMAIASGRLNDRFGPRIVVSISGAVLGCGFILMSQVTAVWQLYIAYGIVIAAGFSGAPVPLMSTVARWFNRRRGLMTGIVMAGTGVGTMVMPPVANWLIYTWDWRVSYAAFGLIVAVVILLAAQLLRRDPSKQGLLPFGEIQKARKRNPAQRVQTGLVLSEAMHTKQFWLLCFALTGFGYALQSVMVHIVIYARGLGLTPASAAAIMTIIGAMGVAGRIGVGGIADRLGARRPLAMVLGALAASLFFLAFTTQSWTVIAFAVLFGFVYGGTVPLFSHAVAELFGLRAHGVILGIITCSVGIGSAVGPVVTGYGFDLFGNYTLSFAIGGGVTAVATILALLVRPVDSMISRAAAPAERNNGSPSE